MHEINFLLLIKFEDFNVHNRLVLPSLNQFWTNPEPIWTGSVNRTEPFWPVWFTVLKIGCENQTELNQTAATLVCNREQLVWDSLFPKTLFISLSPYMSLVSLIPWSLFHHLWLPRFTICWALVCLTHFWKKSKQYPLWKYITCQSEFYLPQLSPTMAMAMEMTLPSFLLASTLLQVVVLDQGSKRC